MANTVLTDIKAPYINDVTLKRVMSKAVKQNIFQEIIGKVGELANETFSEDTDAAEIQIIRVKPNASKARTIGEGSNGGYFNTEVNTSSTEAYGIKILNTIDAAIDIPTNMQDMINVDLVEAETKNLAGKVAQNITACTIATQIAKALSPKGQAPAMPTNAVSIKDDTKILDALIDANSKLDDGNESQGITSYPRDERAILIRADLRAKLMASGQLIVNNSAGQHMIASGGVSPGQKVNTTTGYCGDIDGTPVYVVSKTIWNLVADYLGLSSNTKLDGIKAIVVCGQGTGRALAFNSSIKQIDSPLGQGIRLQPLYRFGVECWDEMSVVLVVNSAFSTNINSNFGSSKLEAKTPGSRG